MPLININDVIGLGQFATTHKWEFVMTKAPTALSGVNIAGINTRLESVTLPKVSTPSVEIQIRGHKVKQPGIADYGNTMTLTFFETTDMYVTEFIQKWKDLCWKSRTGLSVNKSELQCEILLNRFDNNGNPMYTYQIFGAYIEDNENGNDLDASTADAQKPTITLSFDYFLQAKPGETLK